MNVIKWSLSLALLLALLLGIAAQAQDDEQPVDEPVIEQGELPIDEEIVDAEPPGAEEPSPADEEETYPAEDETYEEPEEGQPPLASDVGVDENGNSAPVIPNLDEVMAGKNATVREYIPMDFDFRIALVGEFEETTETYDGGTTTQVKSPLILLNPSNGNIKVHAKNFPARIVANSLNGQWVIAVAPSAAVEGTSGSANREAAVSLNMITGEIKLINEFPLHSTFQALFLDKEKDTILYCVNEPGAVNQIVRYSLETREPMPIPAEGNRFYMYGLKASPTGGQPSGLWVRDPMAVEKYPVVSLLDLQKGSQLDRVEFPGTNEVLAQPDGSTLLASITDRAEASLGYYEADTHAFRQIDNLVLTRPQLKWTNNSNAVIAKETTTTRDRFLWIDLGTGEVRELFSAYYKIGQWDISPADDALVFVVDSEQNPVLFVLPLTPGERRINRIRLRDMSNVAWLGCLNTPQSERANKGSWLDKLIPKF